MGSYEARAQVITFCGVVVDHVQNDLETRFVKSPHHALELLNLFSPLAEGGVLVVRSKEAEWS